MSEPPAELPERRTSWAGRIIVEVRTGRPSDVALAAAVKLARALNAEIESIFVEDPELRAVAGLPFVREISFMGGQRRSLSLGDLDRDLQLAAGALRRRMEVLARGAQVPMHFHVVRDEPNRAVALICEACGEGSLVALGEPFGAANVQMLRRLIAGGAGVRGVSLVGPAASRMSGPVIAAVEDFAGLRRTFEIADHLARALDEQLDILLIDRDPAVINDLERAAHDLARARERTTVVLAQAAHGEPQVVAEAVRRRGGGFVVAQYGGLFVPSEGSLDHLLQALECPLLLLR
jgi:hypothetical protein